MSWILILVGIFMSCYEKSTSINIIGMFLILVFAIVISISTMLILRDNDWWIKNICAIDNGAHMLKRVLLMWSIITSFIFVIIGMKNNSLVMLIGELASFVVLCLAIVIYCHTNYHK